MRWPGRLRQNFDQMFWPIDIEFPFFITDMNRQSLPLSQNFVVSWLVRLLLWYDQMVGTLVAVTRLAGCTYIQPVGLTTMRSWDHVVECQFSQLHFTLSLLTTAAGLKLACKIVSQVHIVTAVLQCLAPLDLFSHDNNRWNFHFQKLRSNNPFVVGLQDLHFAQKH